MSHLDWAGNAARVVCRLAEHSETLTADDVWRAIIDAGMEFPREPRALGAVMRAAAYRRWIVGTDQYVKSERPGCHRRPVRVWRSLMYRRPRRD